MKNIEVEVRLSHYTSNVEPHHGAHLEITDCASHARLATITLTPEQVYRMISNQGAIGTAEVLQPEHYAQKVGKEYKWERVELDEEFAKSIRFTREVDQWMHKLGEIHRQNGNWQGYEWRLHNYGWSLTVWKYEEDEDE